MKVACEVTHGVTENDSGREVECTTVTCSRCDHATESYGTTERSALRSLALLREECPKGEDNFYYDEDEGEP